MVRGLPQRLHSMRSSVINNLPAVLAEAQNQTYYRVVMLRAGYLALATYLQEANTDLSNRDVSSRLSDAIGDAHRGTGKWANYIDHMGDNESGDVVYSCDGAMCQAPYEIAQAGEGASKATVDMANARKVNARTVYEPDADEGDHYAAMTESLVTTDKLYTSLPLYERFISKKERDAADESDFAGKGKSFPILKPEDVTAAAASIGRAGTGNLGPSGIKSRIIAIAKRKGFEKYLPKAWQTADTKESAATNVGGLVLVESAATLETIVLREARSDYEIKLIAPGKGSSAFYPAEVLKRDGPGVFKASTHVYLNHATRAEEAERPEGDVKNLAGVLTTNAVYHEAHAKGPGLYARMKVFADHGQLVEEKAPHVGMSIRANGSALMEAGKPKLHEGLPILAKLTHAESVDVVTRAGAGGMILTEAAKPATETQSEVQMTEADVQRLVESGIQKATAPLLTRALKGDAREAATAILKGITLNEASKERVIEEALRGDLPVVGEILDTAKFTESVNALAKREGAYAASLTGAGKVVGMGTGAAAVQQVTEAEKPEVTFAKSVSIFKRLHMSEAAATAAARGRVA